MPIYYQWKSKYGGLEASELKRVKELESENTKLKRMYAELALDNAVMKDLIAKTGSTPLTRTLQISLIMGQEECHATEKKVQRRVQA